MARSLTSQLYRAARISNTLSAIASGNPHRMARRGANIVIGRTAARLGLFRLLFGGRRR